jgi:hypothetical protein
VKATNLLRWKLLRGGLQPDEKSLMILVFDSHEALPSHQVRLSA